MSNFELMVMLAVIRLRDEAYGLPISEEIAARTGREVSLGSIYAALERLEDKGFVVSEVGEPTAERGGRAKKYFKASAQGLRETRDVKEALVGMWKGLVELQGGRP